jgi:hypothetical protein
VAALDEPIVTGLAAASFANYFSICQGCSKFIAPRSELPTQLGVGAALSLGGSCALSVIGEFFVEALHEILTNEAQGRAFPEVPGKF